MTYKTVRLLVLTSLLAFMETVGWCAPGAISLVTDPQLGRASGHGVSRLLSALDQAQIRVRREAELGADRTDPFIAAGLSTGSGPAAELAAALNVRVPAAAESLAIRHVTWAGREGWLILGADDRGLLYALLETAAALRSAPDAAAPLGAIRDSLESPDVVERAVSIYTMQRAYFEQRLFDEEYWSAYFDLLAENRFNAFVVVFGYENGGYFAPAYPYFFNVPEYPDVHVVGFTPELQQRYTRAFARLIELAHDRGLKFTAGLWDHIYRGGVQSGGVKGVEGDRPLPNVPWGLTATNLADYSQRAFAQFLRTFPAVDAVQFRMHNESGLKPGEEMRQFWKTMYQVVKDVRPDLEFSARAKEFPDELIDLALEMGVNIRICTKYWAEQLGMPFHPTHINRQNQFDRRHGYADLLRYPQRYEMHWRLWNGGTARILLWGDPEFGRRFAESTHLYDGAGFEINEMLATKMEAQPHDLEPFALLQPAYQYYRWEFERYWHFYQTFGRLAYNPRTAPEVWEREFRARFGPEAAPHLMRGLHRASWILPRINASIFPYGKFPTTRGWVEKQRWEDLPAYASAEGSDLQQFDSFNEAATNQIAGLDSAKMHPLENQAWLESAAMEVLASVQQANVDGHVTSKETVSTVTDLRILAHLARYHARRISAGLNYALFKQTQDVHALDEAIRHETNAIGAWRDLVAAAGNVYAPDLMFGVRSANLAGHWRDELVLLENGLAALGKQRAEWKPRHTAVSQIAHTPIRRSRPGAAIELYATVTGPAEPEKVAVMWRPARGETQSLTMAKSAAHVYSATIPSALAVAGRAAYSIRAAFNAGQDVVFPAGGPEQMVGVDLTADDTAPEVEHVPVRSLRAGQELKLSAAVSDLSSIKWARVRYRGVTQFEDYKSAEMHARGGGRFEVTIPAEAINPKWDFMYFLEVMDAHGNGKIYPELDKETPYIIVKLDRATTN